MSEKTILEFKTDEFLDKLTEIISIALKEKNESIKGIEDGQIDANEFANRYIACVGGANLLLSTATYISAPASLIMNVSYAMLRDEGKSNYEAMVLAQNDFINLAYQIATESAEDQPSEKILKKTLLLTGTDSEMVYKIIEKLKDGFTNFKAYTSGDANEYVKFLGQTTHDSLCLVHGADKSLDDALAELNQKYS